MRQALIIAFLLLVLLVAGCGHKVEIKIEPDKSVEKQVTPEQPLCDKNGKCDPGEKCDCADCKETFDCRKQALGENEYLLKRGMSEKIAGKTLTFVDLDSSGRTTISVDGVKREIEKTKFREIINKLEVTVLETEYSIDPDKIIVKLLAKEYSPGADEYLFEQAGSEKIIESVRIRLNKVEASTPKNFVRLDVGNALNEKVSEGETRQIEGLSITLLEAHPRGTPAESYAILKAKKA